MKKLLGIVILSLLWCSVGLAKPKVLECKRDCGTVDVNNEFSFQARFIGNNNNKGCNVTFIEEDIILTAAHCIAIDPEHKNIPCCDAETTKKKITSDTLQKSKFIVDGKNYPKKKIIVAQVLDFSARATGWPPGYDIVIAHVDRNCKKCKKGKKINIVPIPIANTLPKLNTKALHVLVPETSKKGKGRIYRDHLLNGEILGGRTTPCSVQVIKHDGKTNPPMLFGGSGSPVIFKECGKYVVHGLHGRGIDDGKYMYEQLQLLQTQKEWIQSEIFRWTGRTDMIDSCSESGRRSFMPDQKFDVPQNDCVNAIDEHSWPHATFNKITIQENAYGLEIDCNLHVD